MTVTRSSIDYVIASANEARSYALPFGIESQPHVSIKDFNFDGHLDFEVWYVDEGMGTYTIHRVFVFDAKSANFVEASPKCGDEFLNLKVSKARQTLVSTYYVNNKPVLCTTRLAN